MGFPVITATGWEVALGWTGFSFMLFFTIVHMGYYVVTWFTGRRKDESSDGKTSTYPVPMEWLHSSCIYGAAVMLAFYIMFMVGQGTWTRFDGREVLWALWLFDGLTFVFLTIELSIFLGVGTELRNTGMNQMRIYGMLLISPVAYFTVLVAATLSSASIYWMWVFFAILPTAGYIFSLAMSTRRVDLWGWSAIGIACLLWLGYGIVFTVSRDAGNVAANSITYWAYLALDIAVRALALALPLIGVLDFDETENNVTVGKRPLSMGPLSFLRRGAAAATAGAVNVVDVEAASLLTPGESTPQAAAAPVGASIPMALRGGARGVPTPARRGFVAS